MRPIKGPIHLIPWLVLFLIWIPFTHAQETDAEWGTDVEEALQATKLKGNVEDGQVIYEEICEVCHMVDGSGDPAGTFPQLAGQHPSVIIKQMADIRVGNRDNPTMYPFTNVQALTESVEDLFDNPKTGAQTLADVAAFIQTLEMSNTVVGPGTDLEHGAKIYKDNCVRCHGAIGEGDAKDFYPLIAGQNYNYLVRQFKWIKEGKRRNANPDMMEQIENFSEKDILAVMDWVSRQKIEGK